MNILPIEGQKIVRMRPMTSSEIRDAGWKGMSYFTPLALELENGVILFASQDEEGNGPGAMFATQPDGEQFTLFVTKG